MNSPISHISKEFLRDVPNWPNAPVPICMGGDYRALTFCCKPGSSLTFGYKCRRDEKLREIGMTPQEFIAIKEKFSRENAWDDSTPCFGSLTYCCMRRNGCFRRDTALANRYPGYSYEEVLGEYFRLKRILANEILMAAEYQEKVINFIENK